MPTNLEQRETKPTVDGDDHQHALWDLARGTQSRTSRGRREQHQERGAAMTTAQPERQEGDAGPPSPQLRVVT